MSARLLFCHVYLDSVLVVQLDALWWLSRTTWLFYVHVGGQHRPQPRHGFIPWLQSFALQLCSLTFTLLNRTDVSDYLTPRKP